MDLRQLTVSSSTIISLNTFRHEPLFLFLLLISSCYARRLMRRRDLFYSLKSCCLHHPRLMLFLLRLQSNELLLIKAHRTFRPKIQNFLLNPLLPRRMHMAPRLKRLLMIHRLQRCPLPRFVVIIVQIRHIWIIVLFISLVDGEDGGGGDLAVGAEIVVYSRTEAELALAAAAFEFILRIPAAYFFGVTL